MLVYFGFGWEAGMKEHIKHHQATFFRENAGFHSLEPGRTIKHPSGYTAAHRVYPGSGCFMDTPLFRSYYDGVVANPKMSFGWGFTTIIPRAPSTSSERYLDPPGTHPKHLLRRPLEP